MRYAAAYATRADMLPETQKDGAGGQAELIIRYDVLILPSHVPKTLQQWVPFLPAVYKDDCRSRLCIKLRGHNAVCCAVIATSSLHMRRSAHLL